MEIGTVAAQFLFCEYLFRIFCIRSQQCKPHSQEATLKKQLCKNCEIIGKILVNFRLSSKNKLQIIPFSLNPCGSFFLLSAVRSNWFVKRILEGTCQSCHTGRSPRQSRWGYQQRTGWLKVHNQLRRQLEKFVTVLEWIRLKRPTWKGAPISPVS